MRGRADVPASTPWPTGTRRGPAPLRPPSPPDGRETIFHKSSTSLHLWFYAMYLMTSTRCGISAKQLERELGVTYKTAWRMFHLIRNQLMTQDETRRCRATWRWTRCTSAAAAPRTVLAGAPAHTGRASLRCAQVVGQEADRGGPAWSSAAARSRPTSCPALRTASRPARRRAFCPRRPSTPTGTHLRLHHPPAAGTSTSASTTPPASTSRATCTRTPSKASGRW